MNIIAENKRIRSPFLAIVLFVSLTATATAQKIQVFQEAAANYSNIRALEPFPYPISERDDIGNKANIGFEAGITTKLVMKNERFAFPVGIHFQRKGFHVKPQGPVFVLGNNGTIALQTDRIGYRFDYLTVTPATELAILKGTLGLSIGPYLSFRIKEAVKIFDHTGWEDENGDTFIEKADYGLQAGIHACWKRFGLFARYQHGIQKNKQFQTVDENFNPTGFLAFRNRAAVLGLAFRLTNL